MRLLALLALGLMLSACSSNDEHFSCNNSSDYQEFECIKKSDFISASGVATTQSQTIADCSILSTTDTPCTLATQPFLAQSGTPPSKQQILDHLIVSHPWMATRFAEMLDQMPADMYQLLGSVTAIVIHNEIRPAFFWPATGVLYIDPYYLWITPAEYRTVSIDPDFRDDYGDELTFRSFTRYTNNGSNAFSTGNVRSPQQTLLALSAQMFHELAHARDHFPASAIAAANNNQTPTEIAVPQADRVSASLSNTFPLTNNTLFNLADVLFDGKYASSVLKALSAAEAGAALESEGANDDSAYDSPGEDAAMLFEETMMKIHFNIDREIAYVTPLNLQQTTCDDFTFDWTAINRYANHLVIPRARLVVNGLLPGHQHAAFLASPVADGIFSWCVPDIAARGTMQTGNTPSRDFWR